MREGAFWAVGAGLALILFRVPEVIVTAGPVGRTLMEMTPMFLAPAAAGFVVSLLTRSILPWGAWVLAVPAALGTAAAFGWFALGGGLSGLFVNTVYFAGPLVLFVLLLRLSWALGTRVTAGLCAASRVVHTSPEERSPVLREGTGVREFPPGIRIAEDSGDVLRDLRQDR